MAHDAPIASDYPHGRPVPPAPVVTDDVTPDAAPPAKRRPATQLARRRCYSVPSRTVASDQARCALTKRVKLIPFLKRPLASRRGSPYYFPKLGR